MSGWSAAADDPSIQVEIGGRAGVHYQLFMRGLEQVAPYPDTFQTFFVERLIVPVRLVRSWLGG